ncbi:ABC transporter ATP-binding protein [Synechococcus sp. UW140]|uniref:ABC transporter ATP-binding protein n=1 Tax=Synechococcus sp. UW140 TaxID=368503 RepID=UPI003137FC2F
MTSSSENTTSTRVLLLGIWGHLTKRRRIQLGALLVVMLASSAAEVFSLAAVLPFLAVLANPEQIWQLPVVQQIAPMLQITAADQLLRPVTLLFGIAAIASAVVRLVNVWLNGRVAAAVGSDLSCEAYKRTLYQPYGVHVARNSSGVITASQSQVSLLIVVLNALLATFTNGLVLLALLWALLMIDARVALIAGGVFGVAYAVILQTSKKQLEINSKRSVVYSQLSLQALQEGLGSIRDVLLDGSQPLYLDIYRQADRPLRQIFAKSNFIGAFPRYLMEAVGLCLIGGLAYGLTSRSGGISSALPLLGALALGAQRLLPALQQTYTNWATISAYKGAVESVLSILRQPLPAGAYEAAATPLKLQSKISFKNVYFAYSNETPSVLNGLSFEIKKGERVGFIGPTGCGKSTTIDLLMGLLEPNSGEVLVDNIDINCKQDPKNLLAWRAAIAHVPQSIYLADRSIAENIAFGVDPKQLDIKRVKEAARQAQIAEFIESSPQGYKAFVGERGIRLSGGQRQRIGIARALYKKASVMVFDEATSALDNATEKALMVAIDNLSRDLTIVIIAHRLTTLERCDKIIQLKDGCIEMPQTTSAKLH